jgi:hypothetical protein
MNDDRRVIQCNYTEGTNVASNGARAYVMHGDAGSGNERVGVLVRSRGGRWVAKWENTKRLGDFRVKTLPPEHPLYSDERIRTADEYLVREFQRLLTTPATKETPE